MLVEYIKVDKDGYVIGVEVFEEGVDEIPPYHFKGWEGRSFYIPKWDFELEDWVEGIDPQELLTKEKQLKREYLDSKYTESVNKEFPSSNGNIYEYDKDAQAQITQYTSLMVAIPELDSFLLRTKNNGYVNHTREQFLVVVQDAENFKNAQRNKLNNLLHQLENATTVEEVREIDWE